ncbi:hypothetical protein [Serratia marcescens]|uniref:hypothetical protein n=1 Tax=Serratia marcescens TaxID=615 RepID=UPI0018D5BA7C|nr:hypothetical protein [Serratia marcescens]HDU5650676.1 hypothetical protein [Klebsiella aerogenes]
MHPVLAKTFGGLSTAYYVRQFVFGLVISGLILYVATRDLDAHPLQWGLVVFLVINTVLYPYARFVYESVIGFIMGNNIFWVNALLMLFVKLITMVICWSFAIFIAPVGLAYLYYHHSKEEARVRNG